MGVQTVTNPHMNRKKKHLSSFVHSHEQGPLRRVPPRVLREVSERDGSHTGEVGLCWALVEQAPHEHMSDDYKTNIKPVYY